VSGAVETPQQAPADRQCPRCGSRLDPDQDWCLACGTAVRTQVAPSPRWRGPVAIVGAVLALAAAAIVLALLELSNDDGAPQEVAATPPPAATPTPPPQTTPTPPPAATPTPTPGATESPGASPTESPTVSPSPGATESPSPTTSPGTEEPSPTASPSPGASPTTEPGGTAAQWPSGESAWTVILQSTTSKSKAESKAQELSTGGTEAGVLRSDDFSSLRKGYWVVFSGQYDSQAEAQRALRSLKSKASSAYVRFVKPR
jgi:septal ring-binding cell division protein DamX